MIALTRVAGGGFDLVTETAGDALQAAATVAYAVLYTDQRAPVSREPDHYAARGWWAAPDAGTGLWHVRRQGLDDAAKTETLRMVREALERAPGLSGVAVSELAQAGSGRSVSELQVRIEGQHNGRQFLFDVAL